MTIEHVVLIDLSKDGAVQLLHGKLFYSRETNTNKTIAMKLSVRVLCYDGNAAELQCSSDDLYSTVTRTSDLSSG